jgi:hypothetical protein
LKEKARALSAFLENARPGKTGETTCGRRRVGDDASSAALSFPRVVVAERKDNAARPYL